MRAFKESLKDGLWTMGGVQSADIRPGADFQWL